MKRVILDNLFLEVYRNFAAVSGITKTFRHFNIDQMKSPHISLSVATQIHDTQVKKLDTFVAYLEAFPKVTPPFVSKEKVISILGDLNLRMKAALQIDCTDREFYLFGNAWAGCTLRQINLTHAVKNSRNSIDEFVKVNNVVFPTPLTDRLRTSGFGSFVPPKTNEGAPVSVATQSTTFKR
jgi:hypothetical protein